MPPGLVETSSITSDAVDTLHPHRSVKCARPWHAPQLSMQGVAVAHQPSALTLATTCMCSFNKSATPRHPQSGSIAAQNTVRLCSAPQIESVGLRRDRRAEAACHGTQHGRAHVLQSTCFLGSSQAQGQAGQGHLQRQHRQRHCRRGQALRDPACRLAGARAGLPPARAPPPGVRAGLPGVGLRSGSVSFKSAAPAAVCAARSAEQRSSQRMQPADGCRRRRQARFACCTLGMHHAPAAHGRSDNNQPCLVILLASSLVSKYAAGRFACNELAEWESARIQAHEGGHAILALIRHFLLTQMDEHIHCISQYFCPAL